MWISIEEAAEYFGYSHPDSLRRRIRQLREQGKVSDEGNAPKGYKSKSSAEIQILWANPQAMMLNKNAPKKLLNPKKGKRTVKETDNP
jgi:transposase-like protein